MTLQPSRSTFNIEISGSYDLSIKEIWPDGNAPENPTVDDVIAEVRAAGGIHALITDWNLEPTDVEVEGKMVSFR